LPSSESKQPPFERNSSCFEWIASPVKEKPILQDFLFPSKEASFTSTDSAPSLKESPAVSEESHFCPTESSATLKESPPLEETSGPRGLAILSDKNHVNSENSHLSHVGLFTAIILYLFDQLF
jgi:hypothetical protein